MSVGLFRFDRDIRDKNSEIILSELVSSERFYYEYWVKAEKELKLKYIKDGGVLKKVDLDEILTELNILLTWVVENLEDVNLKYMKSMVEGLQTIIPKAFTEDDTNLYIF